MNIQIVSNHSTFNPWITDPSNRSMEIRCRYLASRFSNHHSIWDDDETSQHAKENDEAYLAGELFDTVMDMMISNDYSVQQYESYLYNDVKYGIRKSNTSQPCLPIRYEMDYALAHVILALLRLECDKSCKVLATCHKCICTETKDPTRILTSLWILQGWIASYGINIESFIGQGILFQEKANFATTIQIYDKFILNENNDPVDAQSIAHVTSMALYFVASIVVMGLDLTSQLRIKIFRSNIFKTTLTKIVEILDKYHFEYVDLYCQSLCSICVSVAYHHQDFECMKYLINNTSFGIIIAKIINIFANYPNEIEKIHRERSRYHGKSNDNNDILSIVYCTAFASGLMYDTMTELEKPFGDLIKQNFQVLNSSKNDSGVNVDYSKYPHKLYLRKHEELGYNLRKFCNLIQKQCCSSVLRSIRSVNFNSDDDDDNKSIEANVDVSKLYNIHTMRDLCESRYMRWCYLMRIKLLTRQNISDNVGVLVSAMSVAIVEMDRAMLQVNESLESDGSISNYGLIWMNDDIGMFGVIKYIVLNLSYQVKIPHYSFDFDIYSDRSILRNIRASIKLFAKCIEKRGIVPDCLYWKYLSLITLGMFSFYNININISKYTQMTESGCQSVVKYLKKFVVDYIEPNLILFEQLTSSKSMLSQYFGCLISARYYTYVLTL